MPKFQGKLEKLQVQLTSPVTYQLPVGETLVPLNPALGKTISLHFKQQIYCMGCQKKISKSYQDGYCFPCTQKLARCDLCIIKPERCHFHLGTCREPEWAKPHCMSPHVVYLANASNLKVGITRQSHVLTRWIDQGAVEALPLYQVLTRRISGLVEVIIAKQIADKTNWRKMLSGVIEPVDLMAVRQTLITTLASEISYIAEQFGSSAIRLIENPQLIKINYPVLEYPKKIVSLSLDKTPSIEGTLLGIKGQYLIFDKGVLNIRKFSGYQVELCP